MGEGPEGWIPLQGMLEKMTGVEMVVICEKKGCAYILKINQGLQPKIKLHLFISFIPCFGEES